MRSRLAFLPLAVTLFAGLAHAADEGGEATPDIANGSEFLYQTPAHKFDLTPHFQIGTTVTKFSSNNQKQYEGFFPFGADLEYGLGDMFSFGLDLTYYSSASRFTGDGTKPDSYHTTGLKDPTLQFKGRNPLPV